MIRRRQGRSGWYDADVTSRAGREQQGHLIYGGAAEGQLRQSEAVYGRNLARGHRSLSWARPVATDLAIRDHNQIDHMIGQFAKVVRNRYWIVCDTGQSGLSLDHLRPCRRIPTALFRVDLGARASRQSAVAKCLACEPASAATRVQSAAVFETASASSPPSGLYIEDHIALGHLESAGIR